MFCEVEGCLQIFVGMANDLKKTAENSMVQVFPSFIFKNFFEAAAFSCLLGDGDTEIATDLSLTLCH